MNASGLGARVRMIGKAGEHVACADLFMNGWVATLASEGQPYDILAEQAGKVIRIAVKSTTEARPRRKGARDAYRFDVHRRRPIPPKRLPYTKAEVDVVALVAIDSKQVGYIAVGECPVLIWIYAENADPAHRRFGPKVSFMRRFRELTIEGAICG